MKNKNEMTIQKVTCTNSMQSICARVHSQSGVFTILLYFQRKSVQKQK